MNIQKNVIVASANKRPVLLDLYYNNQATKPQPIVLFTHGFKGFKDWGHWHLIAKSFVEKGFAFAKFNFSHNGTTKENPQSFGDLEAFGANNYSIELKDLEDVLDWFWEKKYPFLNYEQLTLIGHSRGGGIAVIKANQDSRVKALITWASVSHLDYAWQDDSFLENWKKEGVYHVLNGRTKQNMPLYYQIYEDFLLNKELLDISRTMKEFSKPVLIIHGDADPAVPVFAAEVIHAWNPKSKLHIIEGANHVFGGSHPYQSPILPEHTKELVSESIHFIKEQL